MKNVTPIKMINNSTPAARMIADDEADTSIQISDVRKKPIEIKDRRTHIMLTKSMYNRFKEAAESRNYSFNAAIEIAIEKLLKEWSE